MNEGHRKNDWNIFKFLCPVSESVAITEREML
jgi:hypothetical protein